MTFREKCNLLAAYRGIFDELPPSVHTKKGARCGRPSFFKQKSQIFCGLIFQMPEAYSLIVRSEENLPELQMLIQHFLAHSRLS